MKKTICFLLTVFVLLAAIPTVGLAEGTTDAEQAAAGKVCRIGEVYYDTLRAALEAVGDGETITLIGDVEQRNNFVKENTSTSVVAPGITFTLNGNGYTITRPTETSGALFGDVSSNFIFENCKFDLKGDWGGGQMFRAIKPTGETLSITVKDSEINLNNSFAGEDIDEGKKLELLIVNSTINQSNLRENGFFNGSGGNIRRGQTITMTLDHATVNLGVGKLWAMNGARGNLILKNDSHLNILGGFTPITCWGDANEKNGQTIELYRSEIYMSDKSESRGKSYSALLNWTGGMMNLKLDGQSAIRTDRTQPDTGAVKGVSLVRVNTNTNLTVELEKGAVIEMTDLGVKDKSGLVGYEGAEGAGTVNLIDKGAEWRFGKDLLKCGVKLNALCASQIGWTNGAKLYAPDTVVSDAEATETAVFSVVTLAPEDFDMVSGAATRTENPYGLRFTARVSAAFCNRLSEIGATFETGFVIAETGKVIGNFNLSGMAAFDYDSYKVNLGTEETDGDYLFRKAIYGFSDEKESLTKEYSAMAYLKIMFADGTSRTIYSAYHAENHARSVYGVAKRAVEAGITGELLGHIVSVAES